MAYDNYHNITHTNIKDYIGHFVSNINTYKTYIKDYVFINNVDVIFKKEVYEIIFNDFLNIEDENFIKDEI